MNKNIDNFQIIFFELDDDNCLVQEFMDLLDDKMAAKVYGLMDVLSEYGNGFVKKSQKTPRNQIELAKKYRKIFLERQEGKDENI